MRGSSTLSRSRLASPYYSAMTRTVPKLLTPKVFNLSAIPEAGPAVIVASHIAWTDHLVVGLATYLSRGQQAAFLSHERFHRNGLSCALWHRPMRSLPIGPLTTAKTLETATSLLACGGTLCVYPAGGLQAPTVPGTFRLGAFRLAAATGATIVCMGMIAADGTGLLARRRYAVAIDILDAKTVQVLDTDVRDAAEMRVIELERGLSGSMQAVAPAAAADLSNLATNLRTRALVTLRSSSAQDLRLRARLLDDLASLVASPARPS